MAKWSVEGLPSMGVKNTVLMLELVNEPWVFNDISLVRDFYFNMLNKIRGMTCANGCTLPLLWHDAFRHFPWTWLLRHMDLTNVFFDTHLYHAFNIADVASDSEACDRQKIAITENINFANRQIYTFEQQLGWAFWTYKLDDVVSKDPSAPMWSMSLAFDRGYITVPYGARYRGAVPECLEANTNKTLPTPMLQSDVRNLRGRYW
eukprot:gene28184-57757_t